MTVSAEKIVQILQGTIDLRWIRSETIGHGEKERVVRRGGVRAPSIIRVGKSVAVPTGGTTLSELRCGVQSA